MHENEIKLNKRLFEKDVEKVATREGFGLGLLEAGIRDKRIVGLCADLEQSLYMQAFKEKFPERFVEVGVAEQNMATVASGMAHMGKIPFIGSFAIFSPGRNWEQIRTTICYNNVPVKIIGSHAGLSASQDGGSHQMLEDIAIMRALPNMTVISPCDAIEAKKATIAISKTDRPAYLRLFREKTPVITTEETPFEIGKAVTMYKFKITNYKLQINSKLKNNHKKLNESEIDVGIIATGPILYKAIAVARKLASENIGVEVLNLSTIKPLDEQNIIRLAHEAKAIVTVEEHQIAGGMGSAITECLAKHYPIPMEMIGVKDKFGQSGTYEELLSLYDLDEKSIYNATKKVIARKNFGN